MYKRQLLAADVPDVEADVLVLDSLDIEADRRDRGHLLAKAQLVQDGGLACRVEADHEDLEVTVHCGELGPDGGKFGGNIIFNGTPEKLLKIKNSHTAEYLKKELT